MLPRALHAVLFGAVLALPGKPWAASATGTVSVTAIVSGNCRIQSTSDVAFGAYSTVGSGVQQATGTVRLQCSKGSPGGSGSYAARTMLATGFALQYNLYVAAPPSISVWGNGTGTTQMVAGIARLRPPPGRTTTVSHTLYGTIPARQDVAAGAYVDTIVVTLTF